MTQKEMVLRHMKEMGSISSFEAFTEYGITSRGKNPRPEGRRLQHQGKRARCTKQIRKESTFRTVHIGGITWTDSSFTRASLKR